MDALYRGDGTRAADDQRASIPAPKSTQFARPDLYRADQGLADAANVALLLGQPLLLTGEPGTGKTQFAYSLAWELGLDQPLKFETKSSSDAKDLFYTYDALRRFHDAQSGEKLEDSFQYLTYNALGIAILRSQRESDVERFLTPDFEHGGRRRSVVLIDEVDKAPRDFPNDLLNEIEHGYFKVPEVRNEKIEADADLMPIIIITSNSEKNLPDAFLRRCIFYDIPFPDRDRLTEIINHRIGQPEFVNDALELFLLLRSERSGLRKKPATAELLGWIASVHKLLEDAQSMPGGFPEVALRSLSVLIKTTEDQPKASEITRRWIEDRGV